MQYEIIYSGRKTIGISVKEGKVIVRSPYKVSKEYIDNVVSSHASWIEKKLAEQKMRADKTPKLSEEQIAFLKKKARQVLKEKTEKYSQIMGLNYGRITITSAKTRFGSCNAKGNISYSYRLMLYPEAAIDYVVVHELAHLVQMNHSKKFYYVVESVLPDYKIRRKLLK